MSCTGLAKRTELRALPSAFPLGQFRPPSALTDARERSGLTDTREDLGFVAGALAVDARGDASRGARSTVYFVFRYFWRDIAKKNAGRVTRFSVRLIAKTFESACTMLSYDAPRC